MHSLHGAHKMAINNTQKNVINKKCELRDQIREALSASPNFEGTYFEIVGDCDLAFYVTDATGKRQVFQLSGSFKKNNTKLAGQRDVEEVMCDLLDAYEAKEEGRRCRVALAESNKKEKKANGK